MPATKRVTLAPGSQEHMDVDALLQSSHVGTARGSIIVTENPALAEAVLLGALEITYRAAQGEIYLDEKPALPSAEGSNVLRAVTGSGGGIPLLAIASLSSKSQTVSIACIGAGLSSPPLKLQLTAGHTLFTQGCAQAASADTADEFLSPDTKSERDASATGIEITSTAGPTKFGAFGRSSILGSVSFADPATSKSTTTIFAGVPSAQLLCCRTARTHRSFSW